MLSGQNPIFKENNYESEIVLDDDDYTVVGKKETLESKLAELKELHEKNLITDEEYEKLLPAIENANLKEEKKSKISFKKIKKIFKKILTIES